MAIDELAELISNLDANDPYRVVKMLGESSIERTELVVPRDAAGGDATGPRFVRKRITGRGVGAAYLRLYAAQQAGRAVDAVPRIVSCSGDENALTIVLEYVEGETLKDTVAAEGASVEKARRLFPAICDAVSELHERFDPPLIHRDLKPENIIVAPDRIAIIDFTIARAYRDNESTDTVTFGTRAYAPPEQFGYAQTTVRSDVYALGALLYFCLTGRNPDPEALSQGFPQQAGTPHLQSVLQRACAFDPERRYASVRDLETAFERAAAEDANARAASSFAPGFGDGPEDSAHDPSFGRTVRADDIRTWPEVIASYGGVRKRGATVDYALRVAGIIWNICLAISGVIVTAACLANVFIDHPGQPFAFSAASYPSLAVVSVALTFAMMDKRRLHARFPQNRWLTFVGGLKMLAIAIGIALAAIIASGSLTAVV